MRKHLLCFLIGCSLLLQFTLVAFAAPTGVTCPALSVEVMLDAFGTATVLEHWTLNLDETVGSFSRKVAVSDGQALTDWELVETKGGELNLPYTPVDEPTETPLASTFVLTPSENATVVEWFFTPEAKPRTFTLGYTLKNAVVRHADIADYTAAFSDADAPFELETVQVRIHYPEEIQQSQAPTAYLHGTLQTDIQYPEAGVLLISGAKIPAGAALDIRALLPSASFSEQAADEETHKETIVAQEEQVRQEAELAPKLNWLFWGILGLLSLLLILSGLLIRRRVKRDCARFLVETTRAPSFELPEEIHPAALPDFYYFYSPKAEDLRGKRALATLLDLFARGIIRISIQKDESLLARDTVVFTKTADLPPDAPETELSLLTLLFDVVGSGNKCTMADLARYGRHNAHVLGERLSYFDRAARKVFNAYGFVDKTLTRKKRTALVCSFVAFGLAVLVALLGAFLDLRLVALVPSLLIMGALTGSCLFLRRLTADGEERFLDWHVYRHFLKDFKGEEMDVRFPWEQIVINAAALGVLDRLWPQLTAHWDESELKKAFPLFYPILADGGAETLLAAGTALDAYPHERLHSYQ